MGVDRLSVETLAGRVGATKGSFYWHFSDRADLVTATLGEWRDRETSQVMATVDALPADARLGALLAHSLRGPSAAVTLGVITAKRDKDAQKIAREVHATRVGYLAGLLEEKGRAPDQADLRARIAYAAFLGHLLLLGPLSEGGSQNVVEDLQAALEDMLTG